MNTQFSELQKVASDLLKLKVQTNYELRKSKVFLFSPVEQWLLKYIFRKLSLKIFKKIFFKLTLKY